jgi:hypothetical protein
VISDELLDLGQSVARRGPQPAGEPLVEVCSLGLRERLVRRVADEDVAEAEHILGDAAWLRPDQVLAYERGQVRPDIGPGRLGCQIGDRAPFEAASDH